MDIDDLWAMERAAWDALATSAGAASELYEQLLADEVLFLLPGGMVIDDRAAVLESMRGEPWSSFELTDERVIPLGADAAVVAYRGAAERGGVTYTALFSSTYQRGEDGWRLVVHQQTPV